ncbi:hypothetical protein DL93DRAFT_2070574 [Clavulina sp. PMI_390]|nr:hypothetical protein DL93DRAFT_2070574 [Clavulina sp. PMI_390]
MIRLPLSLSYFTPFVRFLQCPDFRLSINPLLFFVFALSSPVSYIPLTTDCRCDILYFTNDALAALFSANTR